MTIQGHAAAMRQCIADSCLQGRGPCRTPMTCSASTGPVDESIQQFQLDRLQNVESIENRWTEPKTVYLAPGVIDKGDPAGAFTPPEDASLLRSFGIPFIAIGLLFGAIGFSGWLLGWL